MRMLIPLMLSFFLSTAAAQDGSGPKAHLFHGKVERVDAAGKTVTVNGDKVDGWKDAGSMTYGVDKEDVLQSLLPGDNIAAKVFDGDYSTLHDVQIVPILNLAHVHLLLNHFPTIGFGLALGLLLAGMIGKREDLQRASMVIFFLVAAIAIPTYLSGNGAQEMLCPPPAHQCPAGVTEDMIRKHEDAALFGFVLMEITGFITWVGLWQSRLISRLPRWSVSAALVLAIVAFVVMARAANIGGEIRHAEIHSPALPESSTQSAGLARSLGSYVLFQKWVWPACETLHFVGLSLLFTVVLLIDLRMLGIAKAMSYAALYQLLPLGMLGFVLNLTTGMLFFIGTPGQYTKNFVFYWKIAFVVVGAVNVLYFMLLDEPWTVGSGKDAPATAKLVAAFTIFLWIGVLFFGHMLPFLGNAF